MILDLIEDVLYAIYCSIERLYKLPLVYREARRRARFNHALCVIVENKDLVQTIPKTFFENLAESQTLQRSAMVEPKSSILTHMTFKGQQEVLQDSATAFKGANAKPKKKKVKKK